MIKILLINCQADYSKNNAMDNKGGVAINTATVESLRQFIPNSQFSTFMQLPDDIAKKIGITVKKNKSFEFKPFSPITSFRSSMDLLQAFLWSRLNGSSRNYFSFLLKSKKLQEFIKSDIIIHVGGDLYSDDYGRRTIIEHSKDILIAYLLKKPVVIYAESLGPFDSDFSKWLARNSLNRVSLITVREEISKQNLEKIGINIPPIFITADPAFLFEPAPLKRVEYLLTEEGLQNIERPLFGITIGNTNILGSSKRSRKIKILKSFYYTSQYLLPESIFRALMSNIINSNHYSNFLKSAASSEQIARIIDYCIEKHNSKILLIPHVVPLPGALFDDRVLMKEVCSFIKNKEAVKVIGNHDADELKGIIGHCDLFIGAKMHATIAATSQGVPTVAIAFGHKFYGVFRSISLEQYVCDSFEPAKLINKIDEVWEKRDSIKNDLFEKMVITKKRALSNAELVKEILVKNGMLT